MSKHEREAAARAAWAAGQHLRAGELIYDCIPVRRRPLWAARVLEIFCAHVSPPRAVCNVLEIAATSKRWREAHDAFTAVRRLTLQQEKLGDEKDPLAYGLLHLAENVAKVAYNASDPAAPFDDDAGWWIAQNTNWLLKQIQDSRLADSVIEALFASNQHGQ